MYKLCVGWLLLTVVCFEAISGKFGASEGNAELKNDQVLVNVFSRERVRRYAANYCSFADSANYRLLVSFVLCIDYNKLQQFERTNIINKISSFTKSSTTKISLYRLYVVDQARVYDKIKSPPGNTCTNRQNLDNGLADHGGWRYLYNGYQTSADVQFTCAQAQEVSTLVNNIKYEVSLNKLHDYVGFHVIGWVLHRWRCPLTPPTSLPEMTSPTTIPTPEPTPEPTAEPTPEPTTEPTTRPVPATEPTARPVPTTEPTTRPKPTAEPTTVRQTCPNTMTKQLPTTRAIITTAPTTPPPNFYCPSTNQASYRLSVSFVLCIDYQNLLDYERTNILNKISTFTNKSRTDMQMYRLYVDNQYTIYCKIRSPPGHNCFDREFLDTGLADKAGWKDVYYGYQTSVDVQFTCKEAQKVSNLVTKIKHEVLLNKLHDHVGFHVIGWVLYQWHCPVMFTTQQTTRTSSTTMPTTEPTTRPIPTTEPTTRPVPTTEPTTRPVPTTEPTTRPVPTTEPTTRPVPTTEPTTRPVPTTEPTTRPVPTTEPTTKPVPTTEPTTRPVPTTEPTTRPVPTTEPTTRPVPTTEPTTKPIPTTEPTTRPVPTTEPTTKPIPTTEPTTRPVPTTEPTTKPMPTTEPATVPQTCPNTMTKPVSTTSGPTTPPNGYCPSTNQASYRLSVSFVLGIDYNSLLDDERTNIINKISTFTNKSRTDIQMYRLYVADKYTIYCNIKSPPGHNCFDRRFLDNGLANRTGWKDVYYGYQTSVDVQFTCKEAQMVSNLVAKIKHEVSLNKLHDHVGFHAIGWVLFQWHCRVVLTTQQPKQTTGDPGRTTPAPITTGDPGRTTLVPVTTGDPGRTTLVPATTGDPGLTTLAPITTGDPGRTTPARSTTGDPGRTTPARSTTGDPGRTTLVPATTGDPGRTTPARSTTGDPGRTTPARSTTGDPGRTTPAPIITSNPSRTTLGPKTTGDPGFKTGTVSPTKIVVSTKPKTTPNGGPLMCARPRLVRTVGAVNTSAGRMLSFRIPRLTFFDLEDGNTRFLSLNLTGNPEKKCWYSFNKTTQILSGLPYVGLLAPTSQSIKFQFNLTATDSCSLQATDSFSLMVTRPSRHCFEMNLMFMTSSEYTCEWIPVKAFVKMVAAYYGFESQTDISVVDFARVQNRRNKFSVKISFAQNIIKCDQCDTAATANLTFKVLHKSNYTVHSAFNAYISPLFTVSNVYVVALDACSAYILPLTQVEKKGLPIWAWLIPVIIFFSALALTLLLALCRYCGCGCCLCLFPAEDDEEYFVRKEVIPPNHHAFEEYVGCDTEYNFPSIRKNRAGQNPDNSSVESADDIAALNENGHGLPAYPSKNEGKTTSVPVTTIVYATPTMRNESTELSIFPPGPGDGTGSGNAVNLMYHNIAETSFQDENYHRTPGNFEALRKRKESSSSDLNNGLLNGGFSSSVSLDMNNVGSTVVAGIGTNRTTSNRLFQIGDKEEDSCQPPPFPDHMTYGQRTDRASSLRKGSVSSLSDEILGNIPSSPLTPLIDAGFCNAAFEADDNATAMSAGGKGYDENNPSRSYGGRAESSPYMASNITGNYSTEKSDRSKQSISAMSAADSSKGILKNHRETALHVGAFSAPDALQAHNTYNKDNSSTAGINANTDKTNTALGFNGEDLQGDEQVQIKRRNAVRSMNRTSASMDFLQHADNNECDMGVAGSSLSNISVSTNDKIYGGSATGITSNAFDQHHCSQINESLSSLTLMAQREKEVESTKDTGIHNSIGGAFVGSPAHASGDSPAATAEINSQLCIQCIGKMECTECSVGNQSTKNTCVSCSKVLQMNQRSQSGPADGKTARVGNAEQHSSTCILGDQAITTKCVSCSKVIQMNNSRQFDPAGSKADSDDNTKLHHPFCTALCHKGFCRNANLNMQQSEPCSVGNMLQKNTRNEQMMNRTVLNYNSNSGEFPCNQLQSASKNSQEHIQDQRTHKDSITGMICEESKNSALPLRSDAFIATSANVNFGIGEGGIGNTALFTADEGARTYSSMNNSAIAQTRDDESGASKKERNLMQTALPRSSDAFECRYAGPKDAGSHESIIGRRSSRPSGSNLDERGHCVDSHCFPVTPGGDTAQKGNAIINFQAHNRAFRDTKCINDVTNTSLDVYSQGRSEHSDLSLNVNGFPAGNAGNVSVNNECSRTDAASPGVVSTSFHYQVPHSQDGTKESQFIRASNPYSTATERAGETGKSTYTSKLQFDGTYRGDFDNHVQIALEASRDLQLSLADYSLESERTQNAVINMQNSLDRNMSKAEQFEFATCESDYDAIRRASLRRTSWQTGYEGGFGIDDKHNDRIALASREETARDTAVVGGIAAARNYGVTKAGIRRSRWDQGKRLGIGDGSCKTDDVEIADLRSSDWAVGRRRYLSDSCIDDDDDIGLLCEDIAGYNSTDENLRLPAVPTEYAYRERSYSLPDELDDCEDHWSPEITKRNEMQRQNLIESIRFVTRPKRDSLRRGSRHSSRRSWRGSLRRRHPDEASLVMRRGWFDVRRSVRVKVPVAIKARVTDPAVITGPPHLDSLKINSVGLPHGAQKPDLITLAGTPSTIYSAGGKALATTTTTEVISDHCVSLPATVDGDIKIPYGTYEVTIPLRQ